MAGTMPHAVFVETGLDGGATVAAYAAELPGCATFASTDTDAVSAIPRRVQRFSEWLRRNDEQVADFVGDNWYEVERAAADGTSGGRASFSLDELPPSGEEWSRWLRWLELAREELAEAMDRVGLDGLESDAGLSGIIAQDESLAQGLGSIHGDLPADPVDRFYAARDELVTGLEAAGPGAVGARRAIRLAIADDLRLASRMSGATD